mgnify:CR=1 FL=1
MPRMVAREEAVDRASRPTNSGPERHAHRQAPARSTGGLRSPCAGPEQMRRRPHEVARGAPSWRSRIRARRSTNGAVPERVLKRGAERDAGSRGLAGDGSGPRPSPGSGDRREAEILRDDPRAKNQTTAAPSSSRSTGRRSTQRHGQPGDHERRRRVGDDRGEPAAPLSRPYARPRSRGAHHVAISRLAGAKPNDCAQPFSAHGIARRPEAAARSSPASSAAQEATAPRRDEPAPAGPVRDVPAHDL